MPTPARTDLTRGSAPVAIDRVGDARTATVDARRRGRDRPLPVARLAITVADLVGTMEGALDTTCEYAKERQQYGVAIGSFQAVQHLLAEARVLRGGFDQRGAVRGVGGRRAAGRRRARRPVPVAKAYCARAARTVCETAIQVHGGIGNTWECFVHVHLRRALAVELRCSATRGTTCARSRHGRPSRRSARGLR